MKRVLLAASLVLAFLMFGVVMGSASNAVTHSAPRAVAEKHPLPIRHGHPCKELFTVKMAERAARFEWRDMHSPSKHGWTLLFYLARCQRNPQASKYVHSYYRYEASLQHKRVLAAEAAAAGPQGSWLASWYDDGGATASGWHSYYGVAMCGSAGPCYSFGTKIRLWYPMCGDTTPCAGARSVVAIVDDHGPYAGGRNIDLNQNTAGALGFGGVGSVGFKVGG